MGRKSHQVIWSRFGRKVVILEAFDRDIVRFHDLRDGAIIEDAVFTERERIVPCEAWYIAKRSGWKLPPEGACGQESAPFAPPFDGGEHTDYRPLPRVS